LTKHTNINEENLKDIMDAMPDEMTSGELCALTLTMHMAYMQKPSEIAKNLIVTIATHAMSQGLTNPEIAKVFNMAAASYLDPSPNQTEH
jgi:ADP-dependent phosphofructokinase/glucokinase